MSSGTCWHCEGDHDTGDCPTRKQWTMEPEPSEPGCICGRGVRCPLHGGPPQPGPEPMTTEHQPGSPGAVDEIPKDHFDIDGNPCTLDTLCRREPAWAANIIRTLRARVESYAMALAALEGTNAANEGALRIQLERLHGERFRAESAEARVKELEARSARRFPIMGGPSIPWEMIAPCERQAQSNHQQSLERLAERGGLDPTEALAVLESRRWHRMDPAFALASLAEAVRRWEDRPLQARITDLESQLAAAREEQELALQVRDWLREECIKLTVAVRPADGRWVADLFNEDDPENFFASVEAETLPALLRAILEVEARS